MNKEMINQNEKGLGFFEKYLTIWVTLCIVIGVAVGQFLPGVPATLDQYTYAGISIPIAILIWFMIYPMMVQVDFASIVRAGKNPKGLAVTTIVNWLIKPFTMFFFAWLFFTIIFKGLIPADLAQEYLAGAILLGAAPCTAMVFVWSYLTKGDAGYTLVQVSVNDILLLFLFAPIVMFLLGVSNVIVPLNTVIASVILFVLIPLVFGYLSRIYLINKKGQEWFDNVYVRSLSKVTMVGLLLTLILLFSFQGNVILNNPLHILLIAIPLIIQTFFIFFIAYGWAKSWKIEHSVAAPAGMIGASNFFELAVAVAIALFGVHSAAALVTVVGVLVEVPLMLLLVKIANDTRHWFPEPRGEVAK